MHSFLSVRKTMEGAKKHAHAATDTLPGLMARSIHNWKAWRFSNARCSSAASEDLTMHIVLSQQPGTGKLS